MSDSSTYDPHWAERTVDLSVRRALVGGAGLWQLVMIWGVLAAPLTPAMLIVLLAAHSLISVLALLVLWGRAPLGLLLGVLYPTLLLDYSAAELGNVLHLVTIWQATLIYACPGALLSRRAAIWVTLVSAAVLPAGVALLHPAWSTSVPISMAAMALTSTAALLVAMPFLRAFARNTDLAAARAEREHQAAAVSRRSSRQAAEDARILHDTVINTLGAIANGGAGIADPAVVRARCARDVATVKALLEGRKADTDDLDGVIATLGIEVQRSGLAAGEWSRLDALLVHEVAQALRGAVGEALRNAAKHADVRHVEVAAQIASRALVITVADQGVGFDGTIEPGRGLAESLLARARSAGIRVELETAPGRGTRVLFRCPLAEGSAPSADAAPEFLEPKATAASIVERACWFLTVGMIGVGLAIEPLSRPGQLTATYAMIAVNAVVVGASWLATRRGRRLPSALVPLLLASIPVTFLLAFAAVGFGYGKLNTWQSLGVCTPMIVLLTMAKNGKPFLAAVAVLLGTIVITAAVIWQDSPSTAMVVPIGAAPAVGLIVGWFFFVHTLTAIIERTAADRRVAWLARVETATRSAADRARDRWRTAGTRESLELLGRVADGTADPRDLEIRAGAAAEEAYLRQLCLLSPEVIQMSPWLGRALAEARVRSVRLTLRTGDVDPPDAESAALLGSCLLAAIAATPPGDGLTVGMFRRADQGRFTLVGSHPHMADSSIAWTVPASWRMGRHHHGKQDLIEIAWAA